MATIGEAIQRVQSLYSKGIQSDDTRLSSRHIYSKLISARAMILLQQVKKKNKISDFNFQDLIAVALTTVTPLPYPIETETSTSYKVRRTLKRIPKPLISVLNHSIDYILSNDGSQKFDEITRKELLHIKGSRFTSKFPRYLIDDGYIYIYTVNVPTTIQVRMLAEDPLAAYMFSNSGDIDVFGVQFSIDESLLDVVIDLAAKELIEGFKSATQDIKNDTISQ